MNLDLGLRRQIRWIFRIADVPYAIIGIDLLHHYNLVVDIKGRRIADKGTGIRSHGIMDSAEIHSITKVNSDNPYSNLLKNFQQSQRKQHPKQE